MKKTKQLFDLQTGEYLTLGGDWVDGDNYVVISTSGLSDFYNSMEYDIISKTLNSCRSFRNLDHELNTKWNGIFKDSVYGDRYVMDNGYSNVIKMDQLGSIIRYHYGLGSSFFPFEVIGNLLEEYSKSLRGEENILAELESFIKI